MRYVAFAVAVVLALCAPLEAKVVDLATMSEATGTYEVHFCARPSPEGKFPGHAFLAFSHLPPDGKRDFFAIGHTIGADVSPGSAAWSYFGDAVPGRLKEEIYTSIQQKCLAARVNRADYDRARVRIADPLQKLGLSVPPNGTVFERYKLGDKDCLNLIIEAASPLKARGLEVPERRATELPMQYISRLIAAN